MAAHRRAMIEIWRSRPRPAGARARGAVVDSLSSRSGGDSGDRTRNLRLAKPALSQLSYIPWIAAPTRRRPSDATLKGRRIATEVVGLSGLEPLTSRLSGARSNDLSYRTTWPSTREERIAHESEVAKGPPTWESFPRKSRLHTGRTRRSDAHVSSIAP